MVLTQGFQQMRHQLRRQKRRVARHHQNGAHLGWQPFHRAGNAGQRAFALPARRIRDHAVPQRLIKLKVTIGADDQVMHMRRNAVNDVPNQRFAIQGLQALVHPAHALALATGQHDGT